MSSQEIEEMKKELLKTLDDLIRDAEFIVKTFPILRDRLLTVKTEYEADLWELEAREFADCLILIKL